MNRITSLLQTASSYLHWLYIALVVIVASTILVWLGLRLWALWRSYHRKLVYLELTPPAFTDKTPGATTQLFGVLHGLHTSRSLADRLTGYSPSYALEVVSSRAQGIRYILGVDPRDETIVTHYINSYLPEVRVKTTTEYPRQSSSELVHRTIEFKQTGHFAFPFRHHDELLEHDPIAYLTGVMTKLSPDEQISFQLIVSPVQLLEASSIARGILSNDDLLVSLGKEHGAHRRGVFSAINSFLLGGIDAIGDAVHSPSSTRPQLDPMASHDLQVALRVKPARTLSAFEQQLAQDVHFKVSQPLYRARVRVIVEVADTKGANERLAGIRASIGSYTVPGYQSLVAVRDITATAWRKYRTMAFYRRLPAGKRSGVVLSSSEVAGLYHFPNSQSARTENVIKSLSKTLPAPVSLKNGTPLNLVIGRNVHHGMVHDIGLTSAERERHVFIVGGTGNGKTTMMSYAMIQDITNGKGMAFVDPHGDAAENLIRHIPEGRIKDVIYFNPDDLSHPIGFNILELDPKLTGDDLLREKDLITETTISVFRKIFSDDDAGGHRIEYVLRNTIQTALTQPNATLFTIYKNRITPQQVEHESHLTDAIQLALKKGEINGPILEKQLNITFMTASRLMDTMEHLGLVAPLDYASPRKILVWSENRAGAIVKRFVKLR